MRWGGGMILLKLKHLIQWRRRKWKKSGPPVFIFAASWRTGSTLLQRIINASEEVFVWGEPGVLPEMRGLFVCLRKYLGQVKWQRDRVGAFDGAIGKWIPVVSPDPEHVKGAFVAFFEELYARETVFLGWPRWGFKEVRSDAVAHMLFLQELYPEARFLFLVRNPWDMYRSIKGKQFHANFENPLQPAQVWRDNVCEYLDNPGIGACCLLIRYEELITQTRESNALLRKVASHLGISLSGKMYLELEARTDSSGANTHLGEEEIKSVSRIVSDAAIRLGYELPSSPPVF